MRPAGDAGVCSVSPVFHIAITQLRARRRQTAVVVGGVVIGVAVLVVTLSLFGGLLGSFTAKILDVAPHVTMKAESAAWNRTDRLVDGQGESGAAVEIEKNAEQQERIRVRNVMSLLRVVERSLADEISVASPYLATDVLASYGTNQYTLPVVGVLPEREARMRDLRRYMVSGSLARLEASRDGILIGWKAAEDLGVTSGDRLRLVSMSGDAQPMQVVGVFRIGVASVDRSAFVNLRIAQALEHALPGEATGIGFQLRDVGSAARTARSIESLTGHATETWEQTNAGVISVFVFLQNLFRVVIGFVVVICGFGIANVLITTVGEKRRDIAVMKSFGISAGAITRIYLLQGVMIALVGGVIGCAVGAVGIYLLAMVPSVGTGGVAPIDSATLQMGWSVWYFVIALASTMLAAVVASVAPARSAARIMPVDVLRGER